MAKILFIKVWPEAIPYLKTHLKKHQLLFLDNLDPKKIKATEILCVGIDTFVPASILPKMPKLRMITTLSTGFDHIDIKTCRKKEILVTNVPSYGSHTVAEHTIALMLALSKKIVQSVEQTRHGNFSQEGLRTMDIMGKTLGIIGFGKIGSHVAMTAKALGMQVLIYSIQIDPELIRGQDYQIVSLNELLKKSDIISLHAPLTPQSKHLIDQKAIAKMKKGVLIINTARGGLIDTKALVHAILTGHVAGAGLDVLEEERAIKEEIQLITTENKSSFDLHTMVANQVLCNQPNVLITPHNAFNSREALQRIIDTGIENIKQFLNKKPIHVVNS